MGEPSWVASARRAVEDLCITPVRVVSPRDRALDDLDPVTGQLVRAPETTVWEGMCILTGTDGGVVAGRDQAVADTIPADATHLVILTVGSEAVREGHVMICEGNRYRALQGVEPQSYRICYPLGVKFLGAA